MARKTRTRRVRRGRGGSRKLNTKLIVDAVIAKLGVDVLPGLLSKFLPIPAELVTVAGVGATWLVGNLLKKPDVSNIAIALGAVELVSPMIGGLVGSPEMVKGAGAISTKYGATYVEPAGTLASSFLADGIRLNDGTYIPYPTAKSARQYASGY